MNTFKSKRAVCLFCITQNSSKTNIYLIKRDVSKTLQNCKFKFVTCKIVKFLCQFIKHFLCKKSFICSFILLLLQALKLNSYLILLYQNIYCYMCEYLYMMLFTLPWLSKYAFVPEIWDWWMAKHTSKHSRIFYLWIE